MLKGAGPDSFVDISRYKSKAPANIILRYCNRRCFSYSHRVRHFPDHNIDYHPDFKQCTSFNNLRCQPVSNPSRCSCSNYSSSNFSWCLGVYVCTRHLNSLRGRARHHRGRRCCLLF
jgi:hypothetical protein